MRYPSRLCKISALFSGLLLLSVASTFAQSVDTVYERGVSVISDDDYAQRTLLNPTQTLSIYDVKSLPALQVSDMIKLFSGIVIRDYGGVGGMKTVAMRGFSSHHTAVVYDGIVVSDGQTGQIDISRFQMQNVSEISVTNGPASSAPVRAVASAGTLSIKSQRPFLRDSLPVGGDFHFTGGSFGLINSSLRMDNLIVRRTGKKHLEINSSLKINYLQSKGDYPFTLHYGGVNDSTSLEHRTSSDVKTFMAEENLWFDFGSRGEMMAKFYYYQSARGLPGAVLFYTTKTGQRLYDQNAFGQLRLKRDFHLNNYHILSYRMFAKFDFSKQRYYDSNYLNAVGYLDNRYLQREYYFANALVYGFSHWDLSLANDLIYGNMNSNIAAFAQPSRMQILTALSALYTDYSHHNLKISAYLVHIGVVNWAKSGSAGRNLSRFAPSVKMSVQPLHSADWLIRAFYQNVYRIPTFNDLYYNEVGNRNLKPENAHQVNLGTTFSRTFRRGARDKDKGEGLHHMIGIELTADGYYNYVKDKIVAIPSKNLFVWSMLNYGKVEMAGLDMTASLNYKTEVKGFSGFSFSGSYSLQHAVDKSDVNSKTFGHQIPYTPLHSGSLSVTLRFTKWLEAGYMLVAAGKRYALQQNISANELAPYADHSVSLSFNYDFNVSKKQDKLSLQVKLEALNLADKHYEIIRNYPMPGRNFRATVGVAF